MDDKYVINTDKYTTIAISAFAIIMTIKERLVKYMEYNDCDMRIEKVEKEKNMFMEKYFDAIHRYAISTSTNNNNDIQAYINKLSLNAILNMMTSKKIYYQ